jgi:uncharacterized protein YdeI (YjbR/CyaY-like superfamily)
MTENTLHVTTREEWRDWLAANGTDCSHIWLIYHKKHTGKPSLPYGDAVEEAICFGWIDATVRRLDEERYMQRFTPRRPRSKWSATNRRRAEALLAAGLVEDEGLARIEEARGNGAWAKAFAEETDVEMPQELAAALKANAKAATNFAGLPAGQRKHFIGWVAVARKPETRQRRAAEAVELLAAGKKLGMK